MRAIVLGCLCVAAISLIVIPGSPGYDAWMWLLWGRELAAGGLNTADGPAFKPLPVALCTLLAPLGPVAPTAWLLIARTGALLAVALAALLARDLVRERTGHGSRAPLGAAVAAAAGVALTESLLTLAAGGAVEATFVASALGGLLAWRGDRPGVALACGICCALLRVEAIPFLVVPAFLLWRDRPRLRPALAGAGLALPLLWLLPDALSTGEILRSAGRARIPNPGQPALAEVPALASLSAAAGLLFLPVGLGALALRPRRDGTAVMLALAGLTWLGLVAAMAQLGFSGEYRYGLPGVAAITVAGAVGLAHVARLRAWAPAAMVAIVVAAGLPRLGALPGERDELAYSARLSADLERAVALAGGREALLACGRPVVGNYRGPLLAYRLDVVKPRVVFEPGPTGVAFESRLSAERAPAPAVPGRYRAVVRAGMWRVLTRCDPRAVHESAVRG